MLNYQRVYSLGTQKCQQYLSIYLFIHLNHLIYPFWSGSTMPWINWKINHHFSKMFWSGRKTSLQHTRGGLIGISNKWNQLSHAFTAEHEEKICQVEGSTAAQQRPMHNWAPAGVLHSPSLSLSNILRGRSGAFKSCRDGMHVATNNTITTKVFYLLQVLGRRAHCLPCFNA